MNEVINAASCLNEIAASNQLTSISLQPRCVSRAQCIEHQSRALVSVLPLTTLAR